MIWIKRLKSICLLMLAMTVFVPAQGGRHSIEGRIIGLNGVGVQDVRVSLKNGNYTDVGQDITDSMGHYRFNPVPDGVYYVEIEPAGTIYEGQSRRVQLVSFSRRPGGSSEIYHFDFQLRPFRPAEKPLPKALAESLVFAQNIPPAALGKYKDAQKYLEKDKKEEAYASLRQAVEIFPDYYDALNALGTEYLNSGWYDVAVPLFMQAVDVNSKGWQAYYGLGSAYSSLKMRKQAIPAFKKSIELNPMNARAFVKLGNELAAESESLDEAIKIFQRAIKLESDSTSECYAALAAIYTKQGSYQEAAEALESYLKTAREVKNRRAINEKIKELRSKPAFGTKP